MARPTRKGLSYYPRDIDHLEDDKVFMLADRYGPLGYMTYDVILSIVFRDGYYIETDCERLTNRIIRAVGSRWIRNRRQVYDIIRYIADIGLINAALLERGVVTSAHIQRCYAEVVSRRKFTPTEYWLLDGEEDVTETCIGNAEGRVSDAETPDGASRAEITATETLPGESESGVTAYNPQTKKSKENKTKENEIKQNKTALPGDGQSSDEMSGEAYAEFCSLIRIPKPAEQLKLEMLCDRYGQSQVVAAIREASVRGGKSAAYVESILRSCCDAAGAAIPAEGTVRRDPLTGDTVVNGMYTHIRTPEELQELNDLLDEELYAEFYASGSEPSQSAG